MEQIFISTPRCPKNFHKKFHPGRPSDFDGVIYEKFDSGGAWKNELTRELDAAGFEINWNLIHKAKKK